VKHRVPLGIARRSQKRQGTWHIADPYVRFWERCILAYIGAIKQGQGAGLVEQALHPTWEQFVAITWAELARQSVYHLARQYTPNFWPETIGSWWNVRNQIDVVGVSYQQRVAWLGEARWHGQSMGLADLEQLQKKAVAWQGNESSWRLYYALFSRSGFTAPLQRG